MSYFTEVLKSMLVLPSLCSEKDLDYFMMELAMG
jgi:hypothetical protein